MNYSMYLLLASATLPDAATGPTATDPDDPALDGVFAAAVRPLRQLVEDFRRQPLAPAATHAFEERLREALREVGRAVVQWTYTPEPGQAAMSRALTGLLREVLARWGGPLPRLCYVTDAGDNETAYHERVLRRLRHPRTGEALEWVRVVDYYHASERVWAMGEMLFGKGRRCAAWARKIQRWLLRPGGANRVLHSAAALREKYGLRGRRRAAFQRAYAYLRDRMAHLRYAGYRRWGVPLGSGVTEAGCKAVFTQRLKLSGMSWGKAGAQAVLDLRVVLLSGVWEEAYARVLAGMEQAQVGGQPEPHQESPGKAA